MTEINKLFFRQIRKRRLKIIGLSTLFTIIESNASRKFIQIVIPAALPGFDFKSFREENFPQKIPLLKSQFHIAYLTRHEKEYLNCH